MLTQKYLRNCWIVLTSRETKELHILRKYLDAEAEITGFDEERVVEYITKYLGDRMKCEELLDTVEKSELINRGSLRPKFGILCIPILRKISLQNTKTGIILTIT